MGREIKWKRLDAGEYESSDERFYILRGWNRLIGKYWELRDRTTGREYIGDTLDDCKLTAEAILECEE